MVEGRAQLVDAGAAVALTGVQLLMLAVGEGTDVSPPPIGWSVLGLSALVLAARRRAPVVTWAVSLLCTAVYGLMAWPDPPLYLGALLAIFTVAARCSPQRSAVVASLSLALALAAWIVDPSDTDANDVLAPVLAVAAAWAAGHAVSAQRSVVTLLTERNAWLEGARRNREEQAVAEERLRIARDLHDITAHHVSVISVQAEAARVDPLARVDALDAISRSARDAMSDLRRLLGVLRDGDGGSRRPQPGIADLERLLGSVRTTSLDVDLVLEGDVGSLADDVQVAVHRIVQEALTNVVRHADASTVVVKVAVTGDGVVVRVDDDGAAIPSTSEAGHGLQGMRERAALYGGSVRAGHRPGGGFTVEAELRR